MAERPRAGHAASWPLQGLGCGRHPWAGTRKLQGTWKGPHLWG